MARGSLNRVGCEIGAFEGTSDRSNAELFYPSSAGQRAGCAMPAATSCDAVWRRLDAKPQDPVAVVARLQIPLPVPVLSLPFALLFTQSHPTFHAALTQIGSGCELVRAACSLSRSSAHPHQLQNSCELAWPDHRKHPACARASVRIKAASALLLFDRRRSAPRQRRRECRVGDGGAAAMHRIELAPATASVLLARVAHPASPPLRHHGLLAAPTPLLLPLACALHLDHACRAIRLTSD